MRILKSLVVLVIFAINIFADIDKKNVKAIENLYKEVLLKDVSNAITTAQNLKIELQEKDINNTKLEFSKLVYVWKSVESFYILGDLNEDYIDIPRYIDIFHNGNEDITKQLDRAIKSKDEIRISLFKNSLKSINALEYMIFAKDIRKKRENEISLAIINKILTHLNEIKNNYIANKDALYKKVEKTNSIIINRVVSNSYKLKEWRVGDVIGKSKKYKGKPNNSRAEYYRSKNSTNAIISVLETYKAIFNNDKIYDYGDYLQEITDGKTLNNLKKAIDNSILEAKKIKNDDFLNTNTLHKETTKVHVILFIEMLEELSINAKILDADGD